jgi:hypothetical protein
MARPIVLVHGYSDKGGSFASWRDRLEADGRPATAINVGNYVSLTNEITIKDIAEGFDRALREQAGLRHAEPFDAIVHSTGMLVVREWLTSHAARGGRLKHLIGLAPATFGSPMAHKGRSWLGAIFKGGRQPGPDFLEAGDRILAALELGSDCTWTLAHRDFLADRAVYGPTRRTPYPFVFIGLKDYGWLRRSVTEPGTDGAVRWAGAGFNTRKIVADLTRDPATPEGAGRVGVHPWQNAIVPLVFLEDLNHATILRQPTDTLVAMVLEALEVSSGKAYDTWRRRWTSANPAALERRRAARWQQFVVHAIDERGDGIADFFLEIGEVRGRRFEPLAFDLDVHPYKDDPSYRCFHVNLDKLGVTRGRRLALRVLARSGTELVGYQGFSPADVPDSGRPGDRDKWDAVVAFDAVMGEEGVGFFSPFTTTLIEIRLNREPLPPTGVNRVFWFTPQPS